MNATVQSLSLAEPSISISQCWNTLQTMTHNIHVKNSNESTTNPWKTKEKTHRSRRIETEEQFEHLTMCELDRKPSNLRKSFLSRSSAESWRGRDAIDNHGLRHRDEFRSENEPCHLVAKKKKIVRNSYYRLKDIEEIPIAFMFLTG